MIYALDCTITELLIKLFQDNEITNILTSTYKLVEYLTFTCMVYLMHHSRRLKTIVKVSGAVYITLVIICILQYNTDMLHNILSGITAIFIFSYSILIMFDWITTTPLEPIYQKPAFWIVMGFFIYESGNYFNFIIQDVYQHFQWDIHTFFAAIRNICFLIAITKIYIINKRLKKRLQQIKF